MKKFTGGLLIFIGLVLAFAVFLPSQKKCEKSVVVNKPVSVVFNALNNIENWQNWLPVLLKDSSVNVSYMDKPNGKRVMAFEGEHFKGKLCIRKKVENKCLMLYMPVQPKEEGEEEEHEHHHHMHKGVFKVWLGDMGDSTVINCSFTMPISYPFARLMMPFKELYIYDLMNKSIAGMKSFVDNLEDVQKQTVLDTLSVAVNTDSTSVVLKVKVPSDVAVNDTLAVVSVDTLSETK